MRLHLRRCLFITLIIVLLQLLITFWGVKQQTRTRKEPFPLRRIPRKEVPLTGTCNPNLCNPVKDDMLNVHVVAHSHTDVGWLKTLEQYYTGQRNVGGDFSRYTGTQCVRCVLNTTIPELLENPDRKFIFIEMSFFSMWWREIDRKLQEQVRQLVKERRLEFVIGGWCMSDSATTYYNDIIDQHTLGFDFIEKNFGPCAQSKVAWHVDQFGHSREHSSLFAQMGFDAIILGRIDYQDLNSRTKQQNLEIVWRSSPDNLGEKSSLFTHISGGYYSPKGFVMDGWAPRRAESVDLQMLLGEIEQKRMSFKTNHVMLPFGSDFGFRQSSEWFDNMDIVLKRVNDMQKIGRKVNMIYSTPSCYFHHVNKAQATWNTKTDDFFPYAVDNGYWTGYFTSKGGLKLHTKRAGALLQACKQLSVFAGLDDVFDKIHVLKAAVAVLQHHDAITGTEKEHVVRDYNKMLSEGETQCQDVIEESYQFLTGDEPQPSLRQHFCPSLNTSMCPVSESSHQMVMFVYNPLSRPVHHWFRLPVTHAQYEITGESGQIPAQVTPLDQATFLIPERKSSARSEAVFRVKLPAMGMSTFFLKGLPGPVNAATSVSSPQLPLTIQNEHLIVTFDTSGRISHVKNLALNIDLPLKQDFLYYESKQSPRASGAYIFAPRVDIPRPMTGQVATKVFRGSESTEVRQTFGDYVHQVVRLYKGADHLELEWTVGPIPTDQDRQGKEVISQFTTDLKSEGEWFTDSNGREMIKRRRDHRETWELTMLQPIAGNYYPVTSKIYIQDKTRDAQLTVLTDRCQGGGSLRDGQLELMVHRRTLYDDGLGVGEALQEMGVDGRGLILRGKHYLYVGTKESSVKFHREKSLEIHFNPTVSFVPVDLQKKAEVQPMAWTSLQSSLPPNVQILSLDYVERNNTDVLLLRLEHFYEKGEHKELSSPATVHLQTLFSAFQVVGIEELSLGANFNVSQVNRLRWKTEAGLTPQQIGATSPLELTSPLSVTLHPMEIRTFHIEVEDKSEETKSFFQNIFR